MRLRTATDLFLSAFSCNPSRPVTLRVDFRGEECLFEAKALFKLFAVLIRPRSASLAVNVVLLAVPFYVVGFSATRPARSC